MHFQEGPVDSRLSVPAGSTASYLPGTGCLSWLCTEAAPFWVLQHHYPLTDSCYHPDYEALLCAVRRNPKVRKYCEQDSEGRACTKKRRGTFQADSYSLQAGQSVQGLPADVLLQIFAFLNLKTQRETLPLVCRHWQEVLQGPVALWRHLELDFPAAMDLGLDGARLTPSRRFQVCPLYVSAPRFTPLMVHSNERQFDARKFMDLLVCLCTGYCRFGLVDLIQHCNY